MGRFRLPDKDIKYGIRNVDYGEYLELRSDHSNVAMRPKKDDKMQHWVFEVLDDVEKTCKIYDTTKRWILYVNASNNIQIGRSSTVTAADKAVWKFIQDPLKDERTYIVTDEQCLMFYMTSRDDIAMFQGMDEQSIKGTIKPQSYQWELVEASAANLPDGQNDYFRIRTLLGKALQHDAVSDAPTLDISDTRGSHRAWKIDDLGNGLCTILNEGSNKYLSASNRTAHWQPILVATESGPGPAVPVNQAWIIQPTSDFTYSISRDLKGSQRGAIPETYALALDGNKAILKPKKAAHNQIWLIEPVDAAPVAVDATASADNGTTTGNGVAPVQTSGETTTSTTSSSKEIFLGIPEGKYRIFNNNDATGRGIFVRPEDLTVTMNTMSYSTIFDIELTSKEEPNAPTILISFLDKGTRRYLAGQAVGQTYIVVVSTSKFEWTVQAKSPGFQRYSIAGWGTYQMTINGNKIDTINVSSNAYQFWSFVRAVGA